MDRAAIKSLITSRMDELLPEGANDSPITNLDKEMDFASLFIIKTAPRELLRKLSLKETGTFKQNSDKTGEIPLPNGYIRFIQLKVEDWKRPLTTLYSMEDPFYLNQYNKHIRGSIYRPVAILKDESIEVFTTEKEEPEYELKYMNSVLPENLTEELQDGLSWLIASRGLLILKHYNESSEALKVAMETLHIYNVGLLHTYDRQLAKHGR